MSYISYKKRSNIGTIVAFPENATKPSSTIIVLPLDSQSSLVSFTYNFPPSTKRSLSSINNVLELNNSKKPPLRVTVLEDPI